MQKIIGPYELLEQLGSGGMGVVYRARDARLQRDVAIKVLPDGFLGPGTLGQVSHERFLREARSASSLNHPNICTIHDVGEQDGKPYLVMELLQGETLRETLKAGALPLRLVLEIAIQITRGLEEAHEAGIIHRDIKPANIFIVRKQQGNQQAKILDFGIAKQARPKDTEATSDSTGTVDIARQSLTIPGSTAGTIAYMSPEQARGEPLDARSDLFSLGSVIYEMATGNLPFPGATTADVLASLLVREPELPRKLNPGVSKEGEQIILKLLAKDKSRRYQTASEVRRDLEQLAARSAPPLTVSPRTGVASPGMGATSRLAFPAIPVAGGVVIAIALAAGGYVWRHGHVPASQATASSAAAPITEKDSIILSDFTNQTCDPVFDTTLNQALAIQLEQSPLLTIVSENHLRQSLKYLGKSSGEKITPEIAREIGVREGIKAILNGAIAKLGNDYIVTLEAQSTSTGDVIAREQTQAADKDHVLTALDQATTTMRARLGESLSSIQKLNTPFGQATTPSLEAFRAYAIGDAEHLRGKDRPEAEQHYLRALELDPNFAMAWARLGIVNQNFGARAKAEEYYRKAFDLSTNVSEREKLYISGHYYQEVQGDLPRAIATLELATQTYPKNEGYWINLGLAYFSIGDLQKSVEAMRHALAIQPGDVAAQLNLMNGLTGLGRLEQAKEVGDAALKTETAESAEFRLFVVFPYFLLGDSTGVQAQMDWAAGKPGEYLVMASVTAVREFAGRYRDAQDIYRRALDDTKRQKLPDVADGYLVQQAQGLALAGMCAGVPALVKQALSLNKSKATIRGLGLSSALCGEAQSVLPLLTELAKKYPNDTMIHTLYLPQTHAADDLIHHRPEQVLRDLEQMGAYNLISQQEYLRGLAYLDLKDGVHAAEAFRKVTTNAGAALIRPLQDYPQAELGLARALAMQGDTAGAKRAYHDFFNTWKDADPDLPQLAQAKAEFSALK
jgi:eukaryotic-like serine/threonine-protein kinase